MATEQTKNVLSVTALVAGFLLSLGMVGAAVAVGFCSLFGEQCSAAEQRTMSMLLLGSLATFLGVPVLVAGIRGQARWLLAPVIEAGALVALFSLAAVL